MTLQVRAQERKPEKIVVLRARLEDEDVLGECHQGSQTKICLQ